MATRNPPDLKLSAGCAGIAFFFFALMLLFSIDSVFRVHEIVAAFVSLIMWALAFFYARKRHF